MVDVSVSAALAAGLGSTQCRSCGEQLGERVIDARLAFCCIDCVRAFARRRCLICSARLSGAAFVVCSSPRCQEHARRYCASRSAPPLWGSLRPFCDAVGPRDGSAALCPQCSETLSCALTEKRYSALAFVVANTPGACVCGGWIAADRQRNAAAFRREWKSVAAMIADGGAAFPHEDNAVAWDRLFAQWRADGVMVPIGEFDDG